MRQSLNAGESFEAVNAREPDVKEDDVEAAVRGAFNGAFSGVGGFGDVAFVGEDGRERFADAGFIVDDEDVRFRGRSRSELSTTYKVQSTR